jgi:hypothetical protein
MKNITKPSKTKLIGTVFILLFVVKSKTFAQEHHEKNKEVTKIEIEQELYPIDLENIYSNLVKAETLVDLYKRNGNTYGLRVFLNTNYHTKNDSFTDFVMYTQSYVGKGRFAMGVELGSIIRKDYISFGPQMVVYDEWGFERLTVHARVWPKYILGCEFTTKEFWKLSSTGMFRYIPQSGQFVGQASGWYSVSKSFNLGIEYEFNNSRMLGKHHEGFLGLKYFFSK